MSEIDRPIVYGKLVEYGLKSGVCLEVMPLSPALLTKIADAAKELFPDPDPKPYELPMKNPLVEGSTEPGENNPLYIEQKERQKTYRNEYTLERILGLACRAQDLHGLIEQYQDQLTELTDITPVYAQWGAIINYFLATPVEVNNILRIAQDKAPLTEGEILDGFTRFQLALPTPRRKNIPGE